MNVLIYNGPGTSPRSVKACHASLTALLVPAYAIRTIDAQALIQEPWQASTALLVLPGGRDLPYCEQLNGPGNSRIARYLHNGGRYLGLCAGAYYASARVEFELQDRQLAVAGSRELKLFEGICRGCTFPGFKYESEDGARAAGLTGVLGGSTFLYYNGGGVFVDAEKDPKVQILAQYADTQDVQVDGGTAAIVQVAVGRGQAILSGVHPEIALASLDPAKLPQQTDVTVLDQERMKILATLLQRLGLKVNTVAAEQPALSTLHLAATTPEAHQNIASLLTSIAIDGLIQGEHDTFALLAAADDRPSTTLDAEEDLDQQYKYISLSPSQASLSQFEPTIYFDKLRRYTGSETSLGSLLLYAETVTSSQTLLDKNFKLLSALPHGLVLLCAHQLSGRGRGSNAWVSPPGVLSFSAVMHHPATANKTLVFVQYLISLATAEAIRDVSGLEVRIKWPNDIYLKVADHFPLSDQAPVLSVGEARYVKVSGSLVSTTYWQDQFIMVAGIGINVSNPQPTVALNTVLALMQEETRVDMESLLARLLALLETFHETMLREGSFSSFAQRYYDLWLHQNQSVTLEETGQQGRVVGIDLQHGTLVVDVGRGQRVGLQADGNSFDMMKGLIRIKRS